MKKTSLVLLAALVLSGCATKVPVAMKFPNAPESLLITCEDLQKVPENEEQLSEMLKVANYGRYHECKAKIDAWIDWYNQQKKVTESVTK